jgi:hypothetical protein
MHRAFREGGRKAIDKVMKNQPAVDHDPIMLCGHLLAITSSLAS